MKEIIHTDKAPAAIGPYSQAVKVTGGNLVFCSGQLGINPQTGELAGDSVEAQCKQVMENMAAVLQAAGGDMSYIVKANIYLADMGDFAAVNEIYASYFKSDYPARAAVAVKTLPKEVKVEIEAIAAI